MRSKRAHLQYQLFILPAFLLFTVFVIAPLVLCIFYSFTDYSVGKAVSFVGLKNFGAVIRDSMVRDSIGFTLVFAVVTTIVITILALVLAILFTKPCYTGKLQRAIFYFPSCISLMVAGYAWRNLLASDKSGLINQIIMRFGGKPIQWLSTPLGAQISVILVAIWIDLGWCATLFFTYIQSIDQDLYEVAILEGANAFQKAWYVTIPMIWPAVVVNLTLLLSQGLKVYEIPQSLTQGGPMKATYTITHAILVRGVTEWDFGTASATGVVIFLITTVLCILQMKLAEREV